jgi:ribonuclease P/MRP protein subunit RPP1
VLSDPQQNYGINAGNEVIRSYDLLAVQPETEKMFHSACTNLDIDIISLDMTVRLPFPVRAGYLRQALARGIVFELMYAPIIVDATARRNIIGNARTLQRLALKGDGLLVTSGAESVWSLRAPADVVNLTGLLGVPAHRRKNCLIETAAATVMHAASRKFAHKSAITILPTETERKNTDMLDDFVEFK